MERNCACRAVICPWGRKYDAIACRCRYNAARDTRQAHPVSLHPQAQGPCVAVHRGRSAEHELRAVQAKVV